MGGVVMGMYSDSSDYEFLDVSIALAQVGDAQTLQGMLTMLEENLGRDVQQIGHLLVAGDVRAANRLLHAIKGFIPIFCSAPICAHVAQVEELSKSGGPAEVSDAYFGLMPKLEQLQTEVTDYLNVAY